MRSAALRIAAHARDPSFANLGGEHRAKPVPPEADGLMADADPTLRQEILDIAQGQRVSQYIITTRRITFGELLNIGSACSLSEPTHEPAIASHLL